MSRPIQVTAVILFWLIFAVGLENFAGNVPWVLAQGVTGDGARKKFEIRQLGLANKERLIVKFNPSTGESWVYWSPSKELEWRKIPETANVPQGDYDIQLLPGVGPGDFWALRFDHVTGRTWNLAGKWFEFKQPK